jgi:hypothetical protein
MKRVLLILAFTLLMPGLLSAATTMGCYFALTPGAMQHYPVPFSFFDVYIYLHNADY